MTRSEAVSAIADSLMEELDSIISYEMAGVIITRLDEALHFDPEVVQLEAVCYGVSTNG